MLKRQKDLAASLVVFLVALPLSMGIAVASGAPVISGLIAAVVGGIVAGACGGAPLLVSGPAAGLAVIVFDFIEKFGFAALAPAIVIAGLLQITFGLLKVARFATGIPPAVLHGMLAGIGILIAAAQCHSMLGAAPMGSFWSNMGMLPDHLQHAHIQATLLGVLSIAILLLWPRLPAFCRLIPAGVAAVGVPTMIATFAKLDVPRVVLPNNVFADLQAPHLPALATTAPIIAAACVIAIIASVESLLSALAVDKLHHGPQANLNKELVGQGLANVTSGLLGGLPITGVIVRSTANIEAGATSKLSTVMHGFLILLAASVFQLVLNQIPIASLAALLIVVGVKLVNIRHIKQLYQHRETLVYAVTTAGVVGINLLAGIGLGLAVAFLRLFYQLARSTIVCSIDNTGHYIVRSTGPATFLWVPHMLAMLGRIPPSKHVRIEIQSNICDHAAHETLHSWSEAYQRDGGSVDLQLGVT